MGLGEPPLTLKPLGNRAIADFVCIAEFVELEQFRRQRFAARVSLTLLLVDAHLQCGGFRHSTNLPLYRRCTVACGRLVNTAAGRASLLIPRYRLLFLLL